MKTHLFPLAAAITILAAMTYSCRNKAPEQTEEEMVQVPGQVTLSRAQINEAGLVFGGFQEAELSHDVNARGKLVLPHDKEAGVSSVIGGIVDQIIVHIGNHVKKGDPLCRLNHPDIIKAQEEYLNARYEFEMASSQYDRQKVLHREKVSSDRTFQESERNFLTAKAGYEAFKINMQQAGFDLDLLDKGEIQPFLVIRSPISGQVDKINATLGNYVDPGIKLFNIVNRSELHIELMVFEKDIPLVAVGQRVTFTLSNLNDRVYEARIFAVGSTMEESARTVTVLAHFTDPPGNIYPGMFVASTIHTGESEFEALPEDALVAEREGDYYVFYTTDDVSQSDPVSFKRVAVKPGLVEEGFAQVELLDSVPAGARYVISGAYYVRAEYMKVAE